MPNPLTDEPEERSLGEPAEDEPGDGDSPEPPPPQIDGIESSSGSPGTEVRITGSRFRAQTGESAVQFVLRAPGFPAVEAEVVSWENTVIRARVPAVSALGTAGAATVTVSNPFGGDSASFTVHDVSTPRITGLSRAVGVLGTELRIFGERFGVSGTEGSAVTLADQGVPVVSWGTGEIRVRVPDPASLGGPGEKPLVVRTPWGDNDPVTFRIAEPPTITSIETSSEAGAPQGPPDASVKISGRGFEEFLAGVSKVELLAVAPVWARPDPVEMGVESWTPTEIRGFIPGLNDLKTTGAKRVVVYSPLAASQPGALTVTDVGSITSWTHLEARARTEDLDAGLGTGLRAEIADPLWMLGQQWRLGELRGEDAGSPISAHLLGESAPLSRWRPGPEGTPTGLPPGVPLETIVERERVFPRRDAATTPFADRRLAVEAGLQFLRNVATRVEEHAQADIYRKRYVEEYGLARPSEDERRALDTESLRFLEVMAGRAPDGARLYADLRIALPPPEGQGELPKKPPIRGRDRQAMLTAIADWFAWCRDLVSEPPLEGSSPDRTAWQRERMEYAFAVSAKTSDGEEIVLEAPEYSEGRLDWHAFVRGSGSLAAGPSAVSPEEIDLSVIPVPVSYPGMPSPRWWEIEEGRVNFGSLDAGPPDLARLLFVEFVNTFGTDWFVIPISGVPVGSLTRVESLTVTDTFGEQASVEPFAGDEEAWSMFRLSGEDMRDLLFVPPTVVGATEEGALEEVVLLRDELANLGWAVERLVASRTGRPLRRHEAYQELLRRAQADGEEPSVPGGPELAYRIMTTVPDHWIPLVPRVYEGSRRLVRAAMRRPRPDGSLEPIPPLGRVLDPGPTPLRIHDEEVPRDGANVTRAWHLARDPSGRTHLWLGRRKGPGRGEGSSGLRFDVVDRKGTRP